MRPNNIFKKYGYVCSTWKEAQTRFRSWDEVAVIMDALWEVFNEEGNKVIGEAFWFLARIAEVHANNDLEERMEFKRFQAMKYLALNP